MTKPEQLLEIGAEETEAILNVEEGFKDNLIDAEQRTACLYYISERFRKMITEIVYNNMLDQTSK